jgi:PAS domain S-box-containing protein
MEDDCSQERKGRKALKISSGTGNGPSDLPGMFTELFAPHCDGIDQDRAFTCNENIPKLTDPLLQRKYLSAVVEGSEDLITLFDPGLCLITANRAMLSALGRDDLMHIVGKNHNEIYSSSLAQEDLVTIVADELEAQTLSRGDFLERERQIQLPDGSCRYFLCRKYPLFDDQEQLMATATIARDISAMKQTRQILAESEEKYRLLFENASDKIFLIGMKENFLPGPFLEVNDAAVKSLGYSRKELISMDLEEIDVSLSSGRLERIMNILRSRGTLAFESIHSRKDGTLINVEVNAHLFDIGKRSLLLFISRNISERKKKETKARHYRQRLQGLSFQIKSVEERYRRKISEQIHERIGQDLLLSKLRVEMALQNVSDQAAVSDLKEACRNMENVLAKIRDLTFDLSPPVLYEFGLKAAIEWLAEKMEKEYQIKISLSLDELPGHIPEEMRVFFYRAVLEFIDNVIKHAMATEIDISVFFAGGDLRIVVADNGIGLKKARDQSWGHAPSSLGLFSIRERARVLGGFLCLGEGPSGGTRIILSVPFDADQEE